MSVNDKLLSNIQRANLTSNPSLVESPFVILTIGDYTFGAATKKKIVNTTGYKFKVSYPDMLQSLSVVKINGEVNSYTIVMTYPITQNDDPNFMDKVFSGVSSSRMITVQYGDWSSPSYIFKQEDVLVQEVTSDIDFAAPKIKYTIKGLGTGYSSTVNKKSWGPQTSKPSDLAKGLLANLSTGLADTFTGMRNMQNVLTNGWLAADDIPVTIPSPQDNLSSLQYLNYITKYMTDSTQGNSSYGLVVYDDAKNLYGGPYFKIQKYISSSGTVDSIDTYEVNIGYPDDSSKVVSFKINDNQEYALLHEYSNKMANPNNYVYRIDTHGTLQKEFSPVLSRSEALIKSTQADNNWFSQVSQYPITATLTLKGLVRPTILLSYVRINTLFYGRKHNTSGTYVITEQTDNVSSDGYKTTLKLLRLTGE